MEEEASEVRLVRCPKCGNLLSEQPNFSVYQCGGCGTVLRAKNKGMTEERLSEVSDDEKGRGIISMNSVNASETEREYNGIDRNLGERVVPNGSSMSRTEKNQVLVDGDWIIQEKIDQGRKVDYRQNLKGQIDNSAEEMRYPVRSLRARSVVDDWTMERNGSMMSRGTDGPRKFSKFPYLDEGPSNYDRGSYDRYGGGRPRFHESMDGLARVANLENDRAELLKKLNELKDQINEKPTGPPTPPDAYKQPQPQPLPRPLYSTHSYGNGPYMDPHDSYHPGYNDAYYPQMLRRPSHEPSVQYPRHIPDYYMNYDQDRFMSHPHPHPHPHPHTPGTFLHQPTCTCSYCYNIQPRGSRNGHPSTVSYHHLNSYGVGQKGYVSDGSYPHLHSRDRQPLTRTPSDLDSETGGFGHRRPREAIITKGRVRARVCHPISGGAPFIACSHCFELLKIPRKLLLIAKNQRQMRCGACSSTLSFEYGTKGIVSEDVSDFPKMENENLSNHRDWAETDASNLESTEPPTNPSSKERKLDPSELQNRQYPRFSSSSFSEDEQSPDSVIVREDISRSAEMLLQDDVSSPHPDHHPSDDVEDRFGNTYKMENGNEKRFILEKITSRQTSVKDTPVETEMDNEFPNSGISQDSMEVTKGGGSRINKFFRGFNNSSKSSQTMENGKSNVFINEQPIPDRILKKVEKVSGPVQPGEYWYDYRAGFWGVMGYPCLGIIPPKIEEFNYPLPENCGNGNTKVYVNGRELHQSDLDLLSSRGLPLTRHKAYLVEMSGKVVDEHTGEEVDNLGKLAPTVERAGHGFGMKVPKSFAQLSSS